MLRSHTAPYHIPRDELFKPFSQLLIAVHIQESPDLLRLRVAVCDLNGYLPGAAFRKLLHVHRRIAPPLRQMQLPGSLIVCQIVICALYLIYHMLRAVISLIRLPLPYSVCSALHGQTDPVLLEYLPKCDLRMISRRHALLNHLMYALPLLHAVGIGASLLSVVYISASEDELHQISDRDSHSGYTHLFDLLKLSCYKSPVYICQALQIRWENALC